MEKPVLKSIARNIGSMEALFPVDNSKVYARVLLVFRAVGTEVQGVPWYPLFFQRDPN